MIKSSDTDVVVIAASVFSDIAADTLRVVYSKGNDFRWISIHDIVSDIMPKTKTLPIFNMKV